MNKIFLVFSIFLLFILSVNIIIPAHAIYLDAVINTKEQTAEPVFKFEKSLEIQYPEGGKIADILRGKNTSIKFSADSTDPGISELISRMNENLNSLQSNVIVTDLKIDYDVRLHGKDNSATIDYNIILTPTITNFILRQGTNDVTTLIDAQWRGMSINGPAIVHDLQFGDIDINSPIGFFKIATPEVYAEISQTKAMSFLNEDIIDAKSVLEQPLSKWLHLFNPLGKLVETEGFGYQGEKIPITTFSMGESSLREGQKHEKVENFEFSTDKQYSIKSIQYQSIAAIQINGIAISDTIDDREYFGETEQAVEGYGNFSAGNFPVIVIFSITGMSVVGTIGFFIWSNKKTKNDAEQVQTGIDPSRLSAHHTSMAAGGYHTNRGEAQLSDGRDYQQHRSVYDVQSQSKENISAHGAMPKDWTSKN